MNDISLKEAQQKVYEWIKLHGVRYFNELTNMALLTEEVGEVARIISRKFGEQSFKEGEDGSMLGEELADVLFVLICIANQTGVELTDEFTKSLNKKTLRDGLRHRNNGKLK
jgi:NTP pyrophosphatase (non-canonical NTP hydrolase)